MADKPLVSVCIPAYNNADTITETMECVLRQTYRHIELIVSDDHSSDDTAAIAEKIAAKDSRVRIYHNEENLGMAGNWNRCLALCRGEYIRLLCADDLIHRCLIEREVALMEKNPEALMISTDTKFINMDGSSAGYYRRYFKKGLTEGREAARFSVFTRDYLGAPLANLFRRSAYQQCGGFDPSFSYIIDYDFFMTIACRGKIYLWHQPYNYFRLRGGSNTSAVMGGGDEKAYIEEHRRLLEKHKKQLGLSDAEITLSVLIRKVMSRLGRLYLKVFMKRDS